ncbi:hypothetical protein [Burkholderia sp. BCC1988]|uniref:hypothetical protein n=1 Tax=Burkholderia sp. BCC1988 TaxID=2817443 RepID=UPI002AB08DC2|nr:hypothetical protein [Burkholderia sp. BCC1988]
MREFAQFILNTPPPLMVSIVFGAAYLAIGIPVHIVRGAVARDVYGTMAGVFAALFYLTVVLGFRADMLE